MTRSFTLPVCLLALCLGGCAGTTPPHRPTRPAGPDVSLRREKFTIPGVRDEWHEPPIIIDRLKQLGGVVEVEHDSTDGKYVVVFNPQRTSRDKIRIKIIEIGEERGRRYDPIFDDR